MKERMDWAKPKSVIEFLLLALMIIQLIYVLWSNLTQIPYHLGYDASSNYLKVFEMYHQGAIFPSNWVDTTTISLDAPTPLAMILQFVFPNVLQAYGVANCICVLTAVVLLIVIGRKIANSFFGVLLLVNLFLCPYIDQAFTNDNALDYYACVLSSGAFYIVRIVLTLMFFYLWLGACKHESSGVIQNILLAVALIGFFVSAVSSGTYMAITVLVPAVLYGIVMAMKKNAMKEMLAPSQRLTYAFLAATAAGILAQRCVLHLQARDAGMTLIPLQDFWANFGSITMGILSLFSALSNRPTPPDKTVVQIFSMGGIACLCGMAIALATLIGTALYVKKQLTTTEWDGTQLMPLIFAINLLVFSLAATNYYSTVFEVRYLIVPAIFLFLCFAAWADGVQRQSVFFKLGCTFLLLCIIVKDVDGDLILCNRKIDTEQMDEVAQMVAEYPDAQIVYFFGENDSILQRNMRVWDTSRYYRLLSDEDRGSSYFLTWGGDEENYYTVKLFGDYTYGVTRGEYDGATLLIADESEFNSLPPELKSYYEKVNTLREWNVYESQTNELAMQN